MEKVVIIQKLAKKKNREADKKYKIQEKDIF